ncbi:hypothetical protein COD94_06405 [Bacillus cereus]|nr:hypothetical protein COD94_06405 [Bacillus cereus]
MINAIYSSKVLKYAGLKQDKFLLPDKIAIREGVSCGDKIALIGEVNNEILEFKIFVINGCILCKAISNYLYEKYNNQNIRSAINECQKWINDMYSTENVLNDLFDYELYGKDKNCVLKPIELFLNFIKDLEKQGNDFCDVRDTSGDLACDACVKTSGINWSGVDAKYKNKGEKLYNKEFSTEYMKDWYRLGKVVLQKDEVELLKQKCKNITDDDINFIANEKIMAPIYSNICDNNLLEYATDQRWRMLENQIHHKSIIKKEIDMISNYLREEGMGPYFIKGFQNDKLYKSENTRVYCDYDLVCLSSTDALKFGNFLFANDYHMIPGIFSLKKIKRNSTEEYSGHYHVMKVIEDKINLIIDVSFPGYPIGRIDILYPTIKNNEISHEDQFIISLCHLFKHAELAIKDINDIYMILNSGRLNFVILKEKLTENSLLFFFSLVLNFIYLNYQLSNEVKEKISKSIKIDFSICENFPEWPYNRESFYKSKKYDLEKRLETSEDISRIHLFPLAMFRECISIGDEYYQKKIIENYESSYICDGIFSVIKDNFCFYVTDMGIFLDSNLKVFEIGRKKYREAIKELLNYLEVNEIMELPFAVEYPNKISRVFGYKIDNSNRTKNVD